MDQIKIIKNFITIEDTKNIINYIDNNIDLFHYAKTEKRFTKMFGNDVFNKERSTYPVTGLKEIHETIFNATELAKKTILYQYNDKEDIFLTSLWFAKQISGAYLEPHIDAEDDGSNSHFSYSAVIYLNTLNDSGDLYFPNLDFSIKTNAGDLVIFPSSGQTYRHEVREIKEDRYNVPLIFTKNKKFELNFAN
jgi:hypothetical protein